jgi:Ca2+-binding EF-hand superfamily protein
MGNTKSSTKKQTLATIAVAKKLALQRFQIVVLRDALASCADSNGMVDKHFFDQALKRAKMTSTEDKEIFDLLFTMWDSEGEEEIPYKPFSVGVSPLACPNDNVVSILRFALHVNDETSGGMITAGELHDVLRSKLSRLVAGLCGTKLASTMLLPRPFNFLKQVLLAPHPTLEMPSC